MATTIRSQISERNPYYISKHRYYELKHFCLQYPEWKKELRQIYEKAYPGSFQISNGSKTNDILDKVGDLGSRAAELGHNISLIEETAKLTDLYLADYLIKAVTLDKSWTYLSTVLGVNCSRDTYYQAYRRFFYILDSLR